MTGRTRIKIWLVLAFVFALGCVTGAALDVLYHARTGARPAAAHERDAQARFEAMRRDLNFLLFGISAEVDDFHAVAERRLDRIKHVCSRDKHHVRKIERYAEVVIPERMVLLRIKYLEQRR